MDIEVWLVDYLVSSLDFLLTGVLGALFGFLLSKDSLKDRTIGAVCGVILCIVFTKSFSKYLGDGEYAMWFSFALGAIGKSTAELFLDILRGKVIKKVRNRDNDIN